MKSKSIGWKTKAAIGLIVGSIVLGEGIAINAEPSDVPTRPLYDADHRPVKWSDRDRPGKSNVPKLNSEGEFIGYADWEEVAEPDVPPRAPRSANYGPTGGPPPVGETPIIVE